MHIKQLDHLNLTVGDLQASIDFYGRVFGFQLVEEGVWNGARWAIVRSGEAMLCMYEHPELDGQPGRGHRISHVGFRIEDPQQWTDTVRDQVVDVHHGPIDYPHSRSWYVRDPSGHEIEVVAWQEDQVVFAPAA